MASKQESLVIKAVNTAFDSLKEWLTKHPEAIAGAGIGAFLNSKAGRALLTRVFTKVLPTLVKAEAKLTGKAISFTASQLSQYVNDLLVKYGVAMDKNAVSNITGHYGPGALDKAVEGVGKVRDASIIGAAAALAGQMVGSYLGNTISAFKGYKNAGMLEKITRVIFPAVYSITDTYEQMGERKVDKMKSQAVQNFNSVRKQQVNVNGQKMSEDDFVGQAIAKSAIETAKYDRAAKEGGFVERPTHPQAENEWQKEVGKFMNKKTQKFSLNAPAWYWQGLASKLMSTVLTWTSLKQYNARYGFVSCCGIRVGLTLPTEAKALHYQVKANTNILWQALRGKNTGAFNYTENDVYAYQWGVSALIARHRYLCKLLSLSNKYDPEVTAQTDALYEAIFNGRGSVVRQDTVVNKPSYCERLNTIAKALNAYALKGNTLISRWNYLADKCISDYNGPKAIKAIYKIELYPNLNPSGSSPELVYVPVNYSTATIGTLITNLEADVDAIRTWNSGVLLKVAGDMIKLLGATRDAFANCNYINGAEVPQFAYDPEAADQLRNGKMFEPNLGNSTQYVAPSYGGSLENLTGGIGFQSPSTNTADFSQLDMFNNEWLVTSDRNKVFSSAENLQLIQFACNLQCKDPGLKVGTEIIAIDHGTSILMGFTIIGYNSSNVPVGKEIKAVMNIGNSPLTVNGQLVNVGLNEINKILQIDFFPSPEITREDAANTTVLFYGRWLDVDDYAYMTAQQYRQMNNVAVYSQSFVFNPEDVKIIGIIG